MSDSTGAPAPINGIRLRLYGCTDVGHVREHNEDNFLIADLTSKKRDSLQGDLQLADQGAVFGVCDGMGGAAAGEIASQLAVDIIFEKLAEAAPVTQRDELARRLVDAVEQAGVRIFHNARNDRARRGMGTTSTIAVLMDERLFLAQVGDSRGYIYRNGALVQVTRDQSLVNQLIEAGQLTEQEADHFEHNNIILQALGTAETVQVDLTYVDLRRGDTLLMCSDGLSGMIKGDEIKEALASETDPMQACRTLIHKANAAGGHDNITVILVQFDGGGLSAVSADDAPLVYRKYPLAERDKRRDTARPGAISSPAPPAPSSPTNSEPPAAAASAIGVAGPISAAPVSSGLKVGHTVIGMRAPLIDFPVQPVRAPVAPTSLPLESGWSPHAVGTTVVSAFLLIASLGYWLLK
ncbi:MAG TPA: Stp1/IreP family PP2C-type Ser/Thr phosphatase [Polyangiaceae bacterium]|jgi:protein phosphatase|nr:Stp1/IreP family PP2C-type Ser/Thr phosphatase [Polyangiaceae bacterium]